MVQVALQRRHLGARQPVRNIDHVRGYRSGVINAIIDALRVQRFIPGPGLLAAETPGGTVVAIRPQPITIPAAHPFRLGCSISGSTMSVSAGSVRFHGIGTAHVVATEIECAMSPMWVCVQVSRSSLTASIVALSSEPDSDYVNMYLPLCVVESVGDASWRISTICHEGDFDFDLPLR